MFLILKSLVCLIPLIIHIFDFLIGDFVLQMNNGQFDLSPWDQQVGGIGQPGNNPGPQGQPNPIFSAGQGQQHNTNSDSEYNSGSNDNSDFESHPDRESDYKSDYDSDVEVMDRNIRKYTNKIVEKTKSDNDMSEYLKENFGKIGQSITFITTQTNNLYNSVYDKLLSAEKQELSEIREIRDNLISKNPQDKSGNCEEEDYEGSFDRRERELMYSEELVDQISKRYNFFAPQEYMEARDMKLRLAVFNKELSDHKDEQNHYFKSHSTKNERVDALNKKISLLQEKKQKMFTGETSLGNFIARTATTTELQNTSRIVAQLREEGLMDVFSAEQEGSVPSSSNAQ